MGKRLLTLLFAVSVAFGSFSQGGLTGEELKRALENAPFRQKFEAANDLYFQKKYFHALQIFLNLSEEQPDNAHINFKVGVCYLKSNTERTKALPYLEKIGDKISKKFDHFSFKETNAPLDAKYYLGQGYHLDYQFDKAATSFQSFIESVSKNHRLIPDAKLQITQCSLGKTMVARPDTKIKIENLGPVVNSPFSDFSPVLSLDGRYLYFTSRRLRADSANLEDFNWDDGKHYEDIYVSIKQPNGEWGEPQVIGLSRTDRNEATIGVSADGMELFVYIDDDGDGNIYFSQYEDTNFHDLQLLGSDINTDSWETHATVSPHGDLLFFVSDRKGGFGGRDIYMCKKLPNGEWGLAQNLGPTINTEHDEDSPFFAADGKTLYFSSNGTTSMGGFDIFVTELKKVKVNDQEQFNWVEPKNMGYPVNTVDDDVFFIIEADGVTGYYSSLHEEKADNHGRDMGYGEKDIYKVTFVDRKIDSVAVLKGQIVPKPGEPIPSTMEIYVTDLKTDERSGPYIPRQDDGTYVLALKPCHPYHVEYFIDEELFEETEFTVPCEADIQTIHIELLLDPIEIDPGAKKLVRWKVIESAVDLHGTKVNYYDADGEIAGTVEIGDDLIFGYENEQHDNTHRFTLDGQIELICKQVCIALIDNDDNVVGYAVRTSGCDFQYEDMGNKWQLVDNQGNAVNRDNVKIIFKDKDGNTSFEEKIGCNGMFAYHALNPDGSMLFEIEAGDLKLCDEVKIVLLDENNKEVGTTIKDEKCRFVYSEKDVVVTGCTDPKAKNYNPDATIDDGSCEYDVVEVIKGCTDPKAKNYNPKATEDDGSCEYDVVEVIKGCTDPKAKNYNPKATEDDGSCEYDVVQVIKGCTDPKAKNYNPKATEDDGSCEYETVGVGITSKYEKYYGYNMKDIRIDEKDFQRFISDCKKIAEGNGVVKIEIKSSASKVPTTKFKTNQNLARHRAEDAKNRVLEALKKQGVDVTKVKFVTIQSLVLGPNYRNDFQENRKTYEKYQYVKLAAK